MARSSGDWGMAVKRTFRTRFRRMNERNVSRSSCIPPSDSPLSEAASCQTYKTFSLGVATRSESRYPTGPSLACSATMQEEEFVCFSSQSTYGGGTVKLGFLDAKRWINRKSDTSKGRTRIQFERRMEVEM